MNPLEEVLFAVFGCGNHLWRGTYQRVPSAIDALLQKLGGKRICERGEADAAGDLWGALDEWLAPFWGLLATRLNRSSTAPPLSPSMDAAQPGMLRVEVAADVRAIALRHGEMGEVVVVSNKELVVPTE